jgi:NAD(P)-dependent dehydrogenase (short-subunit alcohol dehydrogenase family)
VAAGCTALACDVTDEASMSVAVAAVEAKHGAVGVLVNNAGYAEYGPLEEVGLDRWRRQFETNVFGLVRMTQLALPGMRSQRWGRVVNMSSVGGQISLPGGSAYHASKYAVEALSDALRFEVAGFGIRVVLVEPGLITTNFEAAVAAGMPEGEGPYADFNSAVMKSTSEAYPYLPASSARAGLTCSSSPSSRSTSSVASTSITGIGHDANTASGVDEKSAGATSSTTS